MGKLLDLLGGPIKGAIEGIGSVIDSLSTTEEERLKARAALMVIEVDLQKAVLTADSDLAKQQALVLVAEANSASWLARNWRPILMLSFTFIIVWNFIIVGIFPGLNPTEIPEALWELLQLGIGGYILGRSAEKTAKNLKSPL
jgi:hypothetical protein